MSLIVALIIGDDHALVDEIVYQLGGKGVCVFFCLTEDNRTADIVERLKNEGIEPKLMPVDVMNVDSIDKVVGQIKEQVEKLDILINVGLLLDNGQFKINVLSREGFEAKEFFDTLHVSKSFIPLLNKSPCSCVVNVYGQMSDSNARSRMAQFFHDYSSKIVLNKFIDQFNKQFTNTSIKISSVTLGDDKDVQSIQEEAKRIVAVAMQPFVEPSKSKTMRILYGVVGEGMCRHVPILVSIEYWDYAVIDVLVALEWMLLSQYLSHKKIDQYHHRQCQQYVEYSFDATIR